MVRGEPRRQRRRRSRLIQGPTLSPVSEVVCASDNGGVTDNVGVRRITINYLVYAFGSRSVIGDNVGVRRITIKLPGLRIRLTFRHRVELMTRQAADSLIGLAGANQKGWGIYTYTSDPLVLWLSFVAGAGLLDAA
jgi:hypothetical protein